MKKFPILLPILLPMLLSVVLSITFVIAQEEMPERTGFRPDAPPYAIRGPYWVGTMEFVIEDGDRILNGTVWYPALNPDNAEEITEYDSGLSEMLPPELNFFPGHALSGADPNLQNAPYPLVIYSHSNTASRFWTAFYQEHLASYGFVVMAVDHTGTSSFDFITVPEDEYFAVNFIEAAIHRPQDIVRILDFAETFTSSDAALAGMIDMDRVAVTGWSLGGYTALVSAGARIDVDWLTNWCSELDVYDRICNTLDSWDRLAELAGLDTTPEHLWQPMGDSRIDAVITMTSGSGKLLGPEGLASVETPLMAIGGSADSINRFEEGTRLTFDRVSSERKSLVVFENADHYIFGGGSPAWNAIIFDVLSDDVWDMDRAHDLIDHFSVAFLLAELYGDEDALSTLTPEKVQFTGINYEAIGY